MSRPFPRRNGLPAAAAVLAVSFSSVAVAQPVPTGGPKAEITLGEQIDLARLVDVAAQRMKVNIEYDASVLKGTVTLRLGAGISDAELWELTNRLLAVRGFTTIRPPGKDGVLSVVKVESAAGLSKISGAEAAPPQGPEAGYGAVVYQLKHRTAKELTEVVKQVLSKPGGNASALGEKLLLITDLTPRIAQTLAFLETMDVPGSPVEVVEIPATNISGSQLAILAAQVVAKRDLVAGEKAVGEVLPGADGRSVLVIAPKENQEFWRGMLTALDKREPSETHSYIPRYFDLKEVQRLIEETLRATAPPASPASGENAGIIRVVADDLTGTLIVTATATQHQQIGDIIDRLNSIPPEGRRPIRTFKVRNRGVNEVLSVLENLVAAGDLAGDLGPGPDASGGRAPAASAVSPTGPSPVSPGTGSAPAGTVPPEGTPSPSRADAAAVVSGNQSRREGRREGGRTSYGPSSTRTSRGGAGGGGGGGGGESPLVVLTADEGTSSIIVQAEPRLLTQIERLIQQLDVRQPQVMVQALVVSLSDTQTQALGVELEGHPHARRDAHSGGVPGRGGLQDADPAPYPAVPVPALSLSREMIDTMRSALASSNTPSSPVGLASVYGDSYRSAGSIAPFLVRWSMIMPTKRIWSTVCRDPSRNSANAFWAAARSRPTSVRTKLPTFFCVPKARSNAALPPISGDWYSNRSSSARSVAVSGSPMRTLRMAIWFSCAFRNASTFWRYCATSTAEEIRPTSTSLPAPISSSKSVYTILRWVLSMNFTRSRSRLRTRSSIGSVTSCHQSSDWISRMRAICSATIGMSFFSARAEAISMTCCR